MLALSSLPFKIVKQTEYCVSNQHGNLSDFRSHINGTIVSRQILWFATRDEGMTSFLFSSDVFK